MSSLIHRRCLHHPAREAVALCPECRRFYCRECVTEHTGRMICAGCVARLARMGDGEKRSLSAVWFALAVGSNGRVVMTEGDPKNSKRAMRYLKRARLAARVTPLVGDALGHLERERGAFDVILNDIDKWQYPEVLPIARKKLRKGGLLITDNMLWSGRVLRKRADRNSRGVQELTRLLYRAPDFYTTLLPIRDGVTVSLKL